MLNLKKIGTIQSCYKDKFGTPRQPGLAQDSRAFIHLAPEVQPEFSLDGLQGYTHLWVLFIFHKNTSTNFHAKVHPPRLDGKSMGVFATRSPHRPNPIGLSLVKIDEVTSTGVWVSGIDFIDDTPVIDIKPYIKEIESVQEARSGWVENLPMHEISVEWSTDHLNFVSEYENKNSLSKLKQLIEQTLSLDPRPRVYKGYEGEKSPYRESHAVRIYDLDVHFSFVTPKQIRVDNITNCPTL
jgi:tRNA (adenine37-N6)-methyltransferase